MGHTAEAEACEASKIEQGLVAKLRHLHAQQLAEAMPKAFDVALQDAFAISRFLVNGTMRIMPTQWPVLDVADLPALGALSVPSLLVLLFDKRQPEAATVAARDALAQKFLEHDDTQALVIRCARNIAVQAIQDQQLVEAEHQALFGRIAAGCRVADAEQL